MLNHVPPATTHKRAARLLATKLFQAPSAQGVRKALRAAHRSPTDLAVVERADALLRQACEADENLAIACKQVLNLQGAV